MIVTGVICDSCGSRVLKAKDGGVEMGFKDVFSEEEFEAAESCTKESVEDGDMIKCKCGDTALVAGGKEDGEEVTKPIFP